MYDILVYVYENFFSSGVCPDAAFLENRLYAAGFDRDDIDRALTWLNGVDNRAERSYSTVPLRPGTVRCYTPSEVGRLGEEGWGFLVFMESSGILDARERESVVDSVLTAPDERISLAKLKLIVLTVLWRHGRALDALLIDELTGEDNPTLH